MGSDSGFIASIFRLFGVKKKQQAEPSLEEELHLEPKYWTEVKHFMEEISEIVHKQTIEDQNVQIINQRIIDYVEQQINTKGSLDDIEQRYAALNTLADRILVNNLSKIVGLKHSSTTHAEFTEAVEKFKRNLEKRHQDELLQRQEKH